MCRLVMIGSGLALQRMRNECIKRNQKVIIIIIIIVALAAVVVFICTVSVCNFN